MLWPQAVGGPLSQFTERIFVLFPFKNKTLSFPEVIPAKMSYSIRGRGTHTNPWGCLSFSVNTRYWSPCIIYYLFMHPVEGGIISISNHIRQQFLGGSLRPMCYVRCKILFPSVCISVTTSLIFMIHSTFIICDESMGKDNFAILTTLAIAYLPRYSYAMLLDVSCICY